jgi:phosphatidylserine synthase
MEDTGSASFFEEFIDRLRKPWSVLYLIYFIGFILFVSGFGIWNCIYIKGGNAELITNITTYFIAILSTSVVSIINSKSFTFHKTFNVLAVLVLVIGFVLFIIANDKTSLTLGWIGYVLSLIFWIVSTSDDPDLREKNIKSVIDEGQRKHGKQW